MKFISKGVGDFFALDIGTNAVRVVQLSSSQSGWSLAHYGYATVDSKLTAADSAESNKKLGEIIMTAVGQSGIRTKNVVIGLPAQKTFTTVISVPNMPEAELRSTIKYQMDQYVPMNIDDAKVDWTSLGVSPNDPQKIEVLLASTAQKYSEDRLEMVEALGLNVIAAEPDPIAMVRSLVPEHTKDGHLLIDVGEMSTNLVMTHGDTPRLVRSIPTGLSSFVKAVTQNLNVQEDQARQFILKFGLAQDRLEGQVYRALEHVLDSYAAELSKSIKFFQTNYPNTPVSGMLLSGFAATVPQLGDYLAAKTTVPAAMANPWQQVKISQADQQRLAPVANEFAVAVGLAKRSQK